jgi:putative spermidine/putrescine transport system substrate-binding protein
VDRFRMWVLPLVIAMALSGIVAGCGGDDDEEAGSGDQPAVKAPEGPKMLEKLGPGEGELNIIVWAGYAEDGSTDPAYDWVTPFEEETGCQVNAKQGNTSDEMVTLMRTGQYDGVSASGDATLRLIAGGDVAPVNTDLLKNYPDIYDGLKDQPHNSVDGQMYGMPHGRGANLLMWRDDQVSPAPTSWDIVFDPAKMEKYKGKLTAYDAPIYIADAAVYLKHHNPELGIEDPYALDDKQFQAAVDLLKKQREYIGEYWSDFTKQQAAFAGGDMVAGTTWQVTANLLEADGVKIKTTLPEEGSTGWSDTWMISSKAKHPNCMYLWMDHIGSPEGNAAATEYFGEAPSNRKACNFTENKDHCEIFHAGDEEYFSKIAYWKTPTKDCGDDRGAVCKDFSEWTQAWTEIKG